MKKHQIHPFAAIEAAYHEALDTTGHPLQREYMDFLEACIDDQTEDHRLWMTELGPLAARFILALDAWRNREVFANSLAADSSFALNADLCASHHLNFLDHTAKIAAMWQNRPATASPRPLRAMISHVVPSKIAKS